MDNETRKAKAEQLASLMNELNVSVWKGVLSFDGDARPDGTHGQDRIIWTGRAGGTAWEYAR
jgi:hypothetical protein